MIILKEILFSFLGLEVLVHSCTLFTTMFKDNEFATNKAGIKLNFKFKDKNRL